ncbi:MAG: type II secretion system protein GspM [Thiohalophilus sp.]
MRDGSRQLRYTARFPATRYALLVLPAVFLLLFIVWLGIWRPVAVEHARLSASVAETRQTLMSLMRLNELHDEYQYTLKAVEEIETKLERVIPLSEYVERLNALARESEVQIINESRQVGKAQEGYLPVYQELVLETGYASLRQFLSGLSSLPTWTVVNEMRLDKQRDSDLLKANLVLVTFQKQNGEVVE